MSISEGDEDSTSSSSTAPRAAKKRWPRWARIIRAVVIVAVVLILALFFVAPPIARSVLEKQLTTALSTKAVPREAHVEKVRINPLNLSVAIEGLSVTEPARNETLVAWRKLYASLDLRTLVTHEWRFRKIALDGFSGRLAVQKNNQLNIGDLFESSTTAPTTVATSAAEKNLGVPSGTGAAAPTVNGKPETINSGSEAAPAALHINTLIVTDSHLDYSDATLPKPFSTTIGPMSFTVTDFQTGGPDRAPGTFAATTETGETLAWKGNLSIAPLYSRGELRLGNLSIKKYAPYYLDYVGFDVLDGTLDITVNYELTTTTRVFTMRASQSGLTLRSLKLAPRGTTQPMVTINSLALEQLSVESINDDDPAKSRQTIHVARAALDQGSVAFKRNASGLALVTLFTGTDTTSGTTPPPAAPPAPVTTATTAQPASPPLDVILDELAIRNLAVAYEDTTLGAQPLRTNLTLSAITAKNFSLNHLDQPMTIAAALQTENGETLSLNGDLAISPLNARGELRLGNLSMKKYAPYYTDYVGFDVLDGALDLTLNYELTTTPRAFTMKASQSDLTLHSIKLAPRGTTQPMVALDTLALNQIAIENISDDDPAKSRLSVHVARAAIDKGNVAFKVAPNGDLAIVTLFTGTDTTSGTTPPPTTPAPVTTAPTRQPDTPLPDIILDELAIRDLAVAVEDATLGKQPLRANVTLAALDAKNFSLNHLDQPMPVAVALQIENSGTITATGTMSISPYAGAYAANWNNLPLAAGSPYLEQQLPLRVTQGAFTGTAAVTITPAGDLAAAANLVITNFAALDARAAAATGTTPLQSWKQLTVSGVTFATTGTKTHIAINEIALQAPQTQVVIQPDGALNWVAITGGTTSVSSVTSAVSGTAGASLATPATSATTTTTGVASNAPTASGTDSAMLVEIKNVLLADGRVDFHDQSIKPAVAMSLTAITGTISSLSTANLAHAKVNLGAKINDTAPILLAGRLNSLTGERTTSLKFTLTGADLAPLDPYIQKYAGRKLKTGALSIDVTTKLNARFLDSANIITLDNFYFGDKVDSPAATSLPVGLAATLLRDTKGQIKLDIPVQGSLDDPNFKYGRAVWRAIGNLLVKTATAPFNLLASIVGGGDKNAPAGTPSAQADANTSAAADAAAAAQTADQDYTFIGFDAGASTLNALAQQKLATIAQGLNARPALHLDLTGAYDPAADTAALQQHALQQLLAAGTRGHKPLTPDAETLAIKRLYQKQFPPVPQTPVTGAPAQTPPLPPTQDEMRAKLASAIIISDDQLRQLATARAQAVKDYLTSQGRVPASQIDVSKDTAATGSRVNLQLQ